MKSIVTSFTFLFFIQVFAQNQGVNPEMALQDMSQFGQKIEVDQIRLAAATQNGRIKPFATLARETILFLTGSYRKWQLTPEQIYLAISSREMTAYAPIIEIRSIDLRKRLGFAADKKYFSLADLENSQLQNFAGPILQKDQEGHKLNESEKKVTEAFSQMNLFRQIALQQHILMSLDFSWLKKGQPDENSQVVSETRKYVQQLKEEKFLEAYTTSGILKTLTREQEAPELFQHSLSKLETEVAYLDTRPFLWASIFSLLSGFLLIFSLTREKVTKTGINIMFGLVLTSIIIGLGLRVYITLFAPITNMYGTMIWVSFGVLVFSYILYYLYHNAVMAGFMFLGSGLILLLTENIPLILSPDMDPIVAVLRSNFWLSTHVTTITISYAAFTIAMILGNITLIKSIFNKTDPKQIQDFYHYSYRMVQLGCFLLTVGIILGGVWADYSWGRFWGWDPKETWALIADLGFLAILHAKVIGWVTPFSFLALQPVAYLLVIMAWYGVNFILAAGLHSYGFSSGGALAVGLFVGTQLLLMLVAWMRFKSNSESKKLATK